MLVLKRKRGESVAINGDIRVKVTDIGVGWVKLGFDAPEGVTILRRELLARNAIQAAAADSPWTDADCTPAAPCDAVPGSSEKIAELARRVANGESLWSPGDGHQRLYTSEDVAAWLNEDEGQDDGRIRCDEVEAVDEPPTSGCDASVC